MSRNLNKHKMPSAIHLRMAAPAPSLSAQAGRAANFLLGAILRATRGPRVTHLSRSCPSDE